METQQIALLLLLIAASHGLAVAVVPTPMINTTCVALHHSPNLITPTDYEHCVRALSADPAASSATDVRGLAAAAASLTVTNITSTELVIVDLIHNLGICLKEYREMNSLAVGALDDLHAGRVVDASKKLLEAKMNHFADVCDLLLIEGDAKRDPIVQENDNASFLSVMASNIVELMLHS